MESLRRTQAGSPVRKELFVPISVTTFVVRGIRLEIPLTEFPAFIEPGQRTKTVAGRGTLEWAALCSAAHRIFQVGLPYALQ